MWFPSVSKPNKCPAAALADGLFSNISKEVVTNSRDKESSSEQMKRYSESAEFSNRKKKILHAADVFGMQMQLHAGVISLQTLQKIMFFRTHTVISDDHRISVISKMREVRQCGARVEGVAVGRNNN
jgi:hypothetical protein